MPNRKLKKQPQLVQTDKVCIGCLYFENGDFNLCPKTSSGRLLCGNLHIWVVEEYELKNLKVV